jgi:enoyl-CoA hydratase
LTFPTRRPEQFDDLLESSSQYHRDVWNFPKPTIAAVNGPALGGGFDLATLCDLRTGSDSCAFGHPEIKFGAPPIITPLRWIIGEGLARDLCLTGRRILAPEAHRIGLVSQVVEKGLLLEHTIGIGKSILESPPETLRFTKAYPRESEVDSRSRSARTRRRVPASC